MNSIGKKIEIISNIAIIAIAIIIGIVAYQKYFKKPDLSQQPNLPSQPTVPVGSKITLPNIDWSRGKKNIVIALKDGCIYCTESAPFYQRLIKEVEKSDIPIVAVLPHTIDQSKKYLDGLKVSVKEIRQSQMDAIGVQGTPTILLVNDKGEITKGWIGKLPSSDEQDVLNNIK